MRNQRKRVLRRESWDRLPPELLLATKLFLAKEVFQVEPAPTLCGGTSSPEFKEHKESAKAFLAHARAMLSTTRVEPGVAKSLVAGLHYCGQEGRELAEEIRSKILRR